MNLLMSGVLASSSEAPFYAQKSIRAWNFSANCENSTKMFYSLLIFKKVERSRVARYSIKGFESSLIEK